MPASEMTAAAQGCEAHLGLDAGVIHCMSCHDPHASKDPKFFKAQIHPPFAARDCDSCHVVSK